MSKWYPCVFCTENLQCTKYSGDGVISFCVLGPCHDETPSNGDRIRAMSDEELAEFLEEKVVTWLWCKPEPPVDPETQECLIPSCRNCCLDWLKKEVEE